MAQARSRSTAAADPRSQRRRAERGWAVVGLVGPILVLGGLFLSPYLEPGGATPFGFDTSKYMWRATLVADSGLEALPGAAPEGLNTNPDRPAYPVVAAQVGATTQISTLRWALILPAVASVSIGLAAGSLALVSLKEPTWAFGLYAIVVGASMHVARTAVGYADNLLALAVFLALAVVGLRAARGGHLVPGVVLLTAAAVVHWQFAASFAVVLLATAVLLGPESLRALREGGSILRTPSGRLGMLVGGSVVTSLAAFAAGGIWHATVPDVERPKVDRKVALFVPAFRLPITVPFAAAGIAALAWPRDRDRRDGLALLVVWACVSAPGFFALRVLDLTNPAHRLLTFSIGLPVLGAAALAAFIRIADRVRPRVKGVAAIVGVITLLALLVVTTADWWGNNDRAFQPAQLAQVRAAGRYLERADVAGPVIFVVGGRSLPRQDQIIRAGLPAELIPRALLYLGTATNLLAGRPTLTGDPKVDAESTEAWAHVAPILDEQPAMLELSTFQRGRYRPVGGIEVASGVRVLQGPALENGPVPTPPQEAAEPGALVLSAIGALLLIAAVGSGWSTWVMRGRPLSRLGLAPAFGIAALTLSGLVVDRLGFELGGAPGVAAVVSVTALGWFPTLRRRMRPRPAIGASASPDAGRTGG